MEFIRPKLLHHYFIALFLVLAQAHLLIHEVEIDKHAQEEACDICIQYHHIGHAAPSISESLISQHDRQILIAVLHTFIGNNSFTPIPPARAPPIFSLG